MTAKQRLTLRISPGLWRLVPGQLTQERTASLSMLEGFGRLPWSPPVYPRHTDTFGETWQTGLENMFLPLSFSYLIALPTKAEGLTVQFLFRNLIAEEQGDGAISNPFCWDCL